MKGKDFVSIASRGVNAACSLCGLALIWCATNSWAFGRGVPEIDPGSATSAITLLVGSMLVFAPRFRRK